jgi:hypothetical protein
MGIYPLEVLVKMTKLVCCVKNLETHNSYLNKKIQLAAQF